MEKYNSQALKISLAIFLSFFGFIGLIGLAKAAPPDGYDFGRKQVIFHETWWHTRWSLTCYLAVEYVDNNDYITGWTTTGSGAHIYDSFWITLDYTSAILHSVEYEGRYTWVKHMNQARFETQDGGHKGTAYAWNLIEINKEYDGYAYWRQTTIWFVWIATYNIAW